MADGSRKSIEEVNVGDMVLATDPETGETVAREVTHLWVHRDTVFDVVVDGDVITTTEDHPFWNESDEEWQRADQLDEGDLVRGANGHTLEVQGFYKRSARTTTAYNLAVDEVHTYYVGAGEDSVLVHNDCPLGLRIVRSTGNARSSGRLPANDQIRALNPLDRAELEDVLEISVAGRRADLAAGDWLPDRIHLDRLASEESLLEFIRSLR